jgi:phosphoglycolate phosphatase
MSGWSCVLFDLDGTITDSAAGITSTLAHTLQLMGKPVPTPAQLIAFVGPPIMDGFADLGLTAEESHEALALYRCRYQERGAFDSTVYQGIEDALRTIADNGLPIALATSKPEVQALRMLDHYGLSSYFTFIGGASEDEVRSEKADVVAYVLENLRAIDVDTSRPVMIGDRVHDVEGAAANGVPTIFADWGYGTDAERAGSIAIASSPQELPGLLVREQAA